MGGDDPPAAVFADTCVLLNFVQREWERDHSIDLIESETVKIVVSQTVLGELATVSDRRRDIYKDMVDFLLETEEDVEEYDPIERRVYLDANDATHVRRIQEVLAGLDDRSVVLRRLRRFVRAAGRRIEYLESSLTDHAIDPVPPLELRFAIDRILNHSADAKVVTDAATWTTNGGSGVLVTLDNDDLFEHREELAKYLADERGPEWEIQIRSPHDVVVEARPQSGPE